MVGGSRLAVALWMTVEACAALPMPSQDLDNQRSESRVFAALGISSLLLLNALFVFLGGTSIVTCASLRTP